MGITEHLETLEIVKFGHFQNRNSIKTDYCFIPDILNVECKVITERLMTNKPDLFVVFTETHAEDIPYTFKVFGEQLNIETEFQLAAITHKKQDNVAYYALLLKNSGTVIKGIDTRRKDHKVNQYDVNILTFVFRLNNSTFDRTIGIISEPINEISLSRLKRWKRTPFRYYNELIINDFVNTNEMKVGIYNTIRLYKSSTNVTELIECSLIFGTCVTVYFGFYFLTIILIMLNAYYYIKLA